MNNPNWATARLLFSTHLPFIALAWAVFLVAVAVIAAVVSIFIPINVSVWAIASQIVRWVVIFYGYYLTRNLMPVYIGHGRTRREILIQGGLFVLAAALLLTVLMIVGFLLEGPIYGLLGWQEALAAAQQFTAPDTLGATFVNSLLLYLGWALAGLLAGVGFCRSDEAGIATIPIAALPVIATGFVVGANGIPLVGSLFDRLGLAPELAAILCIGSILLTTAVIWLIARDVPIRGKVA